MHLGLSSSCGQSSQLQGGSVPRDPRATAGTAGGSLLGAPAASPGISGAAWAGGEEQRGAGRG